MELLVTRTDMTTSPLLDLVLSMGEQLVVAGGYARQLIMAKAAPEDPVIPAGDLDVFCYGGQPADAVMLGLVQAGFNIRYSAREGSATFTRDDFSLLVQVVWEERAQFGGWSSPFSVLDSFGFTTEQFGIVKQGSGLLGFFPPAALRDTLDRKLMVNRILDPVRLLYRMNKYGRKGYTVDLQTVQAVVDDYMDRDAYEREAMRDGNNRIFISSDPDA